MKKYKWQQKLEEEASITVEEVLFELNPKSWKETWLKLKSPGLIKHFYQKMQNEMTAEIKRLQIKKKFSRKEAKHQVEKVEMYSLFDNFCKIRLLWHQLLLDGKYGSGGINRARIEKWNLDHVDLIAFKKKDWAEADFYTIIYSKNEVVPRIKDKYFVEKNLQPGNHYSVYFNASEKKGKWKNEVTIKKIHSYKKTLETEGEGFE